MSTSENNSAQIGEATSTKRQRRLPGACDACKKKKIRCDSGGIAGQRCTNCSHAGIECTHLELTKNLGSAKGYVEGLEQRLDKMQTLLKKLLPGVDINEELENGIDSLHDEDEELPRNDDHLSLHLEKLKLDPSKKRFFGRSSGIYLIEAALHHKHHLVGDTSYHPSVNRHALWDANDWQLQYLQYPQPQYDFPPEDLMISLVDLYFKHVNLVLPLLHRPTFEKSVSEGLHLHDPFFGGTVLLVCATGARYSDDERAFSEGSSVPSSAGWHYYVQVPVVRTNLQLTTKPTLHEIQCYGLSITYIKSTTVSQSTWTQIGFGLRLALDVGAHRARNISKPTIMDELWKRAFFILLTYERVIGAFAGRPSSLHEEEYDVELPVDVDDEYWDHPDPELNFKQPAGKPSKISFFIHYLKLMDILAYAMRVIYPTRPSLSSFPGRPKMPPTQQLITELDSSLNQWMQAIPEHLIWDPDRHGLEQSAMLYSSYYNLQCFVHRPFIPKPQNPSSLSFPSLTICVGAARQAGRVAKALVEQNILMPFPHCQVKSSLHFVYPLSKKCMHYYKSAFFTAAVVLLLSTWTGRRSGMTSANTEAMSGVEACLQTFKMCEARWPASGRYWDMISDMARVGENLPTTNNKRRRSLELLQGEAEKTSDVSASPRPIAGSYRVMHAARTPLHGPHNFGPGSEFGIEATQSFDLTSFLSTPMSSIDSSPIGIPIQTPPNLLGNPICGLEPMPDLQDHQTETMLNSLSPGNPSFGDMAPTEFDFDTFLSSLSNGVDDATASIWSATPAGYEADDWKVYLSNLQGTGVLDGLVNQQTW
ncbi:hypothetical protein D9757_006104 [Collybiopsis confluens]|uniref:Zn(2)-C6 fungal-type domain-containing protein n=1 Tax=Collybiopsis confluens TaxID=2823264 RepID=A0A8H5HHU8_9AGAR|nr:hypothetical protein D9757_006104 [Collybiopsis confluens]